MESTEISIHQCRVYLAVKSAPDWITAKDVAQRSKVSERTARLHLASLSQVGVLDQASVFPGYRYRVSEKSDKPSRSMLQRINGACGVFGLA